MKPKTDGDPMFRANSRRRRALARVGLAAMMVTLNMFSLRAVSAWARPPQGRPVAVAAPVPMAPMPAPSGRFALTAPAGLDPNMVVKAREDIDPEMVFHPEARHRGRAPVSLAPVLVRPLPARVPPRAAPR